MALYRGLHKKQIMNWVMKHFNQYIYEINHWMLVINLDSLALCVTSRLARIIDWLADLTETQFYCVRMRVASSSGTHQLPPCLIATEEAEKKKKKRGNEQQTSKAQRTFFSIVVERRFSQLIDFEFKSGSIAGLLHEFNTATYELAS